MHVNKINHISRGSDQLYVIHISAIIIIKTCTVAIFLSGMWYVGVIQIYVTVPPHVKCVNIMQCNQ